jgi:fatty-acyl-CoA synthase
MFHANCWGVPYGAVMTGTKIVFPGPHLHADDLLDLMQIHPPTLSLGVPTIWLGLIQRLERAQTEEPGRWRLPEACARWSAALRCRKRSSALSPSTTSGSSRAGE